MLLFYNGFPIINERPRHSNFRHLPAITRFFSGRSTSANEFESMNSIDTIDILNMNDSNHGHWIHIQLETEGLGLWIDGVNNQTALLRELTRWITNDWI